MQRRTGEIVPLDPQVNVLWQPGNPPRVNWCRQADCQVHALLRQLQPHVTIMLGAAHEHWRRIDYVTFSPAQGALPSEEARNRSSAGTATPEATSLWSQRLICYGTDDAPDDAARCDECTAAERMRYAVQLIYPFVLQLFA